METLDSVLSPKNCSFNRNIKTKGKTKSIPDLPEFSHQHECIGMYQLANNPYGATRNNIFVKNKISEKELVFSTIAVNFLKKFTYLALALVVNFFVLFSYQRINSFQDFTQHSTCKPAFI
jgi:hypothetical protein